MNSLDDPYSPVQPFAEQPQQKPDFRSEFWEQVPNMRSNVGRETPATTNRCIFVVDNGQRRAYHGRKCPHLCKSGEHVAGICPHGEA